MGLAGLTAVFGMGTGVAPPVSSPGIRPAGGHAAPDASSRDGGRSVTQAAPVRGPRRVVVARRLSPDACRGGHFREARATPTPSRGEAGGSGWSSRLAVRTGRLRRSPAVHSRPIDLVVFQEPTVPSGTRKPGFGGGFALRCLQRLSGPDLATRRCPERDSRHTRGRSSPILSY
jgi:hypothetical protein